MPHKQAKKEALIGGAEGMLWEYGEDNDGWYVGPRGEQRAWAASEHDAAMIVACVNSNIIVRLLAIKEAICAIEESQPPETTPWNCVDAIRKKCCVPNPHYTGA